MIPIVSSNRAFLFHGDAADVRDVLAPNSVDALVCDPPAGIGFMGKTWDSNKGGRDAWVSWLAGIMGGVFSVLKPGAHGLVWALPRTSHWTGYALENAGFEVRDRVSHFFGTGFPKSLNLPGGLGTALKPACEDWWLVRKPIEGTVADNIIRYGTGGLNIDECRIAGEARSGRWPANVTLEHSDLCQGSDVDGDLSNCAPDCAVALLDAQAGERKSSKGTRARGTNNTVYGAATDKPFESYGDTGGASRFFYVAKPSGSERDLGCAGLPVKSGGEATGREDGSAGVANPRAGAGRGGGRRNFHPTVKSIALMTWLCRLVTPRGGLILDPFAGSCSTGLAALREGFEFVGVEKDPDYVPIAKARLEHALALTEKRAA